MDQALTAPLAELGEQARGYLAQAKAANTRRVYAAVAHRPDRGDQYPIVAERPARFGAG